MPEPIRVPTGMSRADRLALVQRGPSYGDCPGCGLPCLRGSRGQVLERGDTFWHVACRAAVDHRAGAPSVPDRADADEAPIRVTRPQVSPYAPVRGRGHGRHGPTADHPE